MKRTSSSPGGDGSDNDEQSISRAAQRFKTAGEGEGGSSPEGPPAGPPAPAAAAAAIWAATDALVEETEKVAAASAQEPQEAQEEQGPQEEQGNHAETTTTTTTTADNNKVASRREILGQATDMYQEALAKSSNGRAPHGTFENICKILGEVPGETWLTCSKIHNEITKRRKKEAKEEAFVGAGIASKVLLVKNKNDDDHNSIIRQAADMYLEAVASSSTGRVPHGTFENIFKALGDPKWLTRSKINAECAKRRRKKLMVKQQQEQEQQQQNNNGDAIGSIASKLLFKKNSGSTLGSTTGSRPIITLNENKKKKKSWTEQEEEIKQAARHEATVLAADMYLEAAANSSTGRRAPHRTFEAIHQALGCPEWLTRGTIHTEVRRRRNRNKTTTPTTTTTTTTSSSTHAASSSAAIDNVDEDDDDDDDHSVVGTHNNASSNRTEQEKQLKREEARLRRQQLQLQAKEERLLRYDLAVAHRLTAKHNMAGHDVLPCSCQHISARLEMGEGCLITSSSSSSGRHHQLWSQVAPKDLEHAAITSNAIHAAIYQARDDVGACIHLHSPSATAVSCLEGGFVPLTQDAAYFYKKVATYSWNGDDNNDETETSEATASSSSSQGAAITQAIQSVPGCNTLLLENHGVCCFGASVREAWVLAFLFEQCCATQLRVMQAGKYKVPTTRVMEAAAQTCNLAEFAPGACEQWDALCKEFTF